MPPIVERSEGNIIPILPQRQLRVTATPSVCGCVLLQAKKLILHGSKCVVHRSEVRNFLHKTPSGCAGARIFSATPLSFCYVCCCPAGAQEPW